MARTFERQVDDARGFLEDALLKGHRVPSTLADDVVFRCRNQILAALERETVNATSIDKLSGNRIRSSEFLPAAGIQMLRRFSNLAVLCFALAAAAGMLAWVATIAINVLLDSPGDGGAALRIVQPMNESGSNQN